jgi:hypothetical protein
MLISLLEVADPPSAFPIYNLLSEPETLFPQTRIFRQMGIWVLDDRP